MLDETGSKTSSPLEAKIQLCWWIWGLIFFFLGAGQGSRCELSADVRNHRCCLCSEI